MWQNYLGKGSAFLIGGSANVCYDKLIELLGGPRQAKIVILTHASELPDAGREIAQEFWQRGVPDSFITWIGPGEALKIPIGFKCAFFCGGNQRGIMAHLTRDDKEVLKKFLFQGGMLAGNSAGVPVFSELMIAGGSPLVVNCALEYGPGLNIIPGIFFDMHFAERMRHRRAVTAIGQFFKYQPDLIGIDEDTGLYIQSNGLATVMGYSGVHVYRATADFSTDLDLLSFKKYLQVDFAKQLAAENDSTEIAFVDPQRPACDKSFFLNAIGLNYSALGAGATIDLATWRIKLPKSR
ncbi:cyanophycinase [soil metagenome]